MKGFGLILVVLCGAGTGWLAAMRVRQERLVLERLCQMLREFAVQMEFRASTVQEIFAQISEQTAYAIFSFPAEVLDGLRQGMQLSAAWRAGMSADRVIPAAVCEMLLPLGEALGTTDLIGQMQTLEQYRRQLEQYTAERAARTASLQRLYLSMGALGGMMAAVLLC